jgi:hypothetical protein
MNMRAVLAAVLLFLGACTTAPPAPAPEPVVAAPAAAVEPAPTHPDLVAELLAMRDADQEVRHRWLKDQKNTAIVAEMEALDAKHVVRLRQILAQYGWPGKSMVGVKPGGAAWMIAQHGGPEILAETLPMMYEAVKKGELEEALYATSLDRVLIQQGKKQAYGTQFDTDPATGKCEPKPIEDAEHVDERRIRAGMGPLADYKAQLCALYMQKQP